jgi:hypothetical protein
MNPVPFWREAQTQLENVLGKEAVTALNDLLDLASRQLQALINRMQPLPSKD